MHVLAAILCLGLLPQRAPQHADDTPPVIRLQDGAPHAASDGSFTIRGVVSDDQEVRRLTADGAPVELEGSGLRRPFVHHGRIAGEEHTVVLVASDTAGNTSTHHVTLRRGAGDGAERRRADLEEALRERCADFLQARAPRKLSCTRCRGAARVSCSACGGKGHKREPAGRYRWVTKPCTACGGRGDKDCVCPNGYRERGLKKAVWGFLSPASRERHERDELLQAVAEGRALQRQLGAALHIWDFELEEVELLPERARVRARVLWGDHEGAGEAPAPYTTEWIRSGRGFYLATEADAEPEPMLEDGEEGQ